MMIKFAACAWLVLASVIACTTVQAGEQLVVSNYGVQPSSLPWAIALKQGYLKGDGLNIETIVSSTGGGTSVRNMLASDNGFAEIGGAGAIQAAQSGIELQIVGQGNNNVGELSWVTLSRSDIKTIQDLKGKKVGFTNPRSTTEMALKSALKQAKVEDVATMPTGGFGAALTMLDQGAIDAAPIIYPALLNLDKKYRIVFHSSEYTPPLAANVLVATPEAMKSSPKTISALINARLKAVDFMSTHTDEAAAIYADVWQMDRNEAGVILRELIKMNFWSRGGFDENGLTNLVASLQLVGAITEPVDTTKLVSKDFLPAELR